MADDTQLPLNMPATTEDDTRGTLWRSSGAVTMLPALTRRDAEPASWNCVASWRGLTARERHARWEALAAWIDWLIEAYRLPSQPWRSWWTCPGACEELAALHDWHRELVDVQVGALDEERATAQDDPESLIEWHRHEQSIRREQARGHVDWHDALWRVLTRLVGAVAEQKPLLVRDAEMTDGSRDRRDAEARDRERRFGAWIDVAIAP